MKILYPWIPNYTLNYPSSKVQGGAEDVCIRFLEALEGHEVDLLVSSDSVVEGPFNVIKGDYLSKEKGGKVPKIKYTQTLIELAPSYDLVVLNDNFLSFSQKVREGILNVLAPKTLVIQHDPASMYFSGFHLSKFQMHQAMANHGAKIAYVSYLMQEELEKAAPTFSKNPNRDPSLPLEAALSDRWEWFDIKEVSPFTCPGIKPCNGNWVIIGRSAPTKKILSGVRAFLKSGKKHLDVFTKGTTDKKDEMEEIKRLGTNKRVTIHEDATREEIFQSLLSAEGYIFPSLSESLGLVSFEAMSCGCPVVYTVDNATVHLRDSETSIWVDKRTASKYSKAIDSITPDKEKRQEQWEHCQEKWSHEKFKERVEKLIVSYCNKG